MGQGRLRHQVDGTAGLPSAPDMPCAPRQLRLVPQAELPGLCKLHRLSWAIAAMAARNSLGGVLQDR
jgi:hypothetical protein